MNKVTSNKWITHEKALKTLLDARTTCCPVTQVEPYHGLVKVMKNEASNKLDSLTFYSRSNRYEIDVNHFYSEVKGKSFHMKTSKGNLDRRTWEFDDFRDLVVVMYLDGKLRGSRQRQRKTKTYHAPAEPRATSPHVPSVQELQRLRDGQSQVPLTQQINQFAPQQRSVIH